MYTKGDWKRNDTGFVRFTTYRGKRTGGRAFVVNEELSLIAEAQGDSQEEAEANAKLIAAAPGLLEALKDIVEQAAKSYLPLGADLADSIRVFGKQAIAEAEETV